jgi:hypothetical protein
MRLKSRSWVLEALAEWQPVVRGHQVLEALQEGDTFRLSLHLRYLSLYNLGCQSRQPEINL